MKLQIGDVVFIKGTSIVAKLVMFFTKSEYSHVAMVISDKHIIEADWYKKSNIVELSTYKPEQIHVFRLKGELSSTNQMALLQHSYDLLNKPYDYFQLFGYVKEFFTGKAFRNPFNSTKRVICSELVDRAYLEIGIDLVEDRYKGNVTPADLEKSKLLERVY